jgi:hypothetical protein
MAAARCLLAITLCLFAWAMETHEERQDPEPAAIAKTYTDSAIRSFWPHARAANRKNEVSLRDIRRHALGERLDEEQTKQPLDGLERAGWLRKVTQPIGPKGGKPVVRWQVNSALYRAAQTAETAET